MIEIVLSWLLVPICALLCILLLLALVFWRPLARRIRRRSPRLGTHLRIAATLAALGVAGFVFLSGLFVGQVRKQYLFNEPLQIAASEGDLVEVERLLELGASPDAWGIDFLTPAIVSAAAGGYYDIVTLLIEGGADVDVRDYQGLSALDQARTYGHDDVVRLLLEAGAKD